MTISDVPEGPVEPAAAVEPTSGIEVSFDEAGSLVVLSGEVDLALRPDLIDVGHNLLARGAPVRFDLSRVTFIDSIGMSFLAGIAAVGRDAGSLPVMVGANRLIRESLALAGLTALFEFDG